MKNQPQTDLKRELSSRQSFRECYHAALKKQKVPLIYLRQSYDAVRDSGLHLHEDHYAFYLVHSGRGLHEINGHPYAIARGDVYLAAPGSIHAYRNGQNLEVDCFVFPIELLREEEIGALRDLAGFANLFVTGGELNARQWSTHRLHLTPEQWREIESRVREVRAELERAQDEYAAVPGNLTENASEILARTLFFRLLVEVARLWHQSEAMSTPANSAATYRSVEFAEVLRWCEAHFTEEISVPQLAAKMFLSPSRFAEIWKRETGAPPGEYFRRLKLNQAQTLLRTSDLSAGQIARECGFHDAAQFSRTFKKAFGVSPSAYRKNFK